MKILIDNGHGENTLGKRSPDGRLREYKWSREIASRIVEELTAQGYDAERIVPEDIDVSLRERVRRVNSFCDEIGKNNVIIVSIHCNAAGMGDRWMNARGWSAYTTKGKTSSDELANRLYEAATEHLYEMGLKLRKDISDGDPDWEENFYILRKTKCAAVLTENFFQDNEEDVKYLLSIEGKEAIVQLHVKGIINYIASIRK